MSVFFQEIKGEIITSKHWQAKDSVPSRSSGLWEGEEAQLALCSCPYTCFLLGGLCNLNKEEGGGFASRPAFESAAWMKDQDIPDLVSL